LLPASAQACSVLACLVQPWPARALRVQDVPVRDVLQAPDALRELD
jgi:hypothetical protein